ncbi:MAG: TatD family hydrolase [Alphaproteobacteria bacterium]|jgi:TatD DNase family protein|nr:TatD family hydrolase [Alphaproteobacteria bacterium]MDP6516805.1 TatD family hydrolase [Alphaproteobacteria bacterium]
MLVDSHCHLDFPDFADDRDQVVARARSAGIGAFQTICTKLSAFPTIRDLAARHADMYCSVGVHPHHAADEAMATPETLIRLGRHPKVIGIGETGLDYHYENSPRAAQKQSFRAHIGAARETGLPVIVHSRDADADTAEMLAEESAVGAFPGVIHCFTADREVAEMALACGLYISVSGIMTFKGARALRGIIADLPLDRLLVETDAPFLAPVPKRGRRNEPGFVCHIADSLAELLNLDPAEVAAATTRNFFALFTKARPTGMP